jgi:large subunit ribosomal protein L15
MVVRRKKKVSKYRGSKTHGWGSKKKHRGKGSKGGKGRAGMGKRGQQKLPALYARGMLPLQRGIKGFKRHKSLVKAKRVINVSDVERYLDVWVEEGICEKKGQIYLVDIDKVGYDKLLGAGKIEKRVEIKVKEATPKAVEKVESAGGKVVLFEGGEK